MVLQIPIQEISTLAILIPLILAGIKLKTGDLKLRLFFVFLLFGAMADGLGWFLYLNEYSFSIHSIFQFLYLWFEALFFVWLAFEFLSFTNSEQVKKGMWIFLNLLFIVNGIYRFPLDNLGGTFSAIVYSLVLIISSFLVAFALLRMAESRDDLLKYAWFWILSGIFFYCFGSFFIDLLSYTDFGIHLWGFRNVVNIIQYGFFVLGLVRLR